MRRLAATVIVLSSAVIVGYVGLVVADAMFPLTLHCNTGAASGFCDSTQHDWPLVIFAVSALAGGVVAALALRRFAMGRPNRSG